jgi:selenocysteine lyase/cysteine desulfurase
MWFDDACLGEGTLASASSPGNLGDVSAVGHTLRERVLYCIEWAGGWTGVHSSAVVLTSNATQACDLAVRVDPRNVELILYTDHAHDTVQRSVAKAAAYLSHVRGEPVSTKEGKPRLRPSRRASAPV